MRSESTEQIIFVERLRHFYPDVTVMAIPNGGMRRKVEAARLKAEGTLAGAPDLFIALARQGYHGMFIEMKRVEKSSTSKVQRQVHERLISAGYKVVVCKGCESAWTEFKNYVAVM
jgi:hypothetical protein